MSLHFQSHYLKISYYQQIKSSDFISGIFMKEHDPRNPYGPNYQELPYDTKVYYKFCKISKYVHYNLED